MLVQNALDNAYHDLEHVVQALCVCVTLLECAGTVMGAPAGTVQVGNAHPSRTSYRSGGTESSCSAHCSVEPHAELLDTPRCSTSALSHRYLQLPLQCLAALGHWSEDTLGSSRGLTATAQRACSTSLGPTKGLVDENPSRRTTVSEESVVRTTAPEPRFTVTGCWVHCVLHDSVITLFTTCSIRH
jgi:hypothetical protein